MKKRKPPVVLATCLFIMLGAVVIINIPRGPGGNTPEAPPPTTETEDRPTMSTSDVSNIVSGSVKSDQKGGPGAGPSMQLPGTNQPSIAISKTTNMKPVPNDSNTSTQWYTDEAKKPGK